MRRRLLVGGAGAVCLALVLLGCSGGGDDGSKWSLPAIGPADVEVDTPELRAAKADAGVADCPDVAGQPVEGGLPEVTLPCFGGGPDVNLAHLRGPLVVNVWAQWCTPCRNEMPDLEAFHQQYGDRVPLIGIDYQDPQTDDAMEFLAETGATYPQLADPGAAIDGIGETARPQLPLTLLVAESGEVAFVKPGEIESPAQLADLVETHLGVAL